VGLKSKLESSGECTRIEADFYLWVLADHFVKEKNNVFF
jgi:hypothetical protein